jgi:hypothetical protein
MVATLGPAVRGSRTSRLRIPFLFVASLCAGSIFLVLPLIIVGHDIYIAHLDIFAFLLIAFSASLAIAQLFGMRAVQRTWQVPRGWRYILSADVLAVSYGFLLGPGFLTSVVVSAFWVFLTTTLIVPASVVIIGWLTYTLVRGMGILLVSLKFHDMALPRIARSQMLLMPAAILSTTVTVTAGMAVFRLSYTDGKKR